jgi:hypothetical protein
MTAADFETQLASIIKSAIGRKVPVVQIIHTLDNTSVQMKLGVNQALEQLSAKETANRIIPSSTIPDK